MASPSSSSSPAVRRRLLLPVPLARHVLSLTASTPGIPSTVKVTTWGTPLEYAKHVMFYFGGMPASAEEPALHSAAAAAAAAAALHDNNDNDVVVDVYATRQIHLICIDKPGMGQSSFAYRFQIRRDWPVVVDQVAQQLRLPAGSQYGVIGMSNGGPYVMSTLTHPQLAQSVKAGCMVVGVSDVWASGYFSIRSPSTFFEGLFNSLPLAVSGPFNAVALYLGGFYLLQLGGFESFFKTLPVEAKDPLRQLVQDGTGTWGLGAGLDCQQGLSPLFARQSKDLNPESADRQAELAYSEIKVPVSLWYGTQDSTVPMESAEWLAEKIPNATLHKVDDGHGLFFTHAEKVLDEMVRIMDGEN